MNKMYSKSVLIFIKNVSNIYGILPDYIFHKRVEVIFDDIINGKLKIEEAIENISNY